MSTMGRQNISKINHLLQNWPEGSVAPTAWLKDQGISRQLLARYEEYNWVKRLAKGVVTRNGDEVTWQGVVYSLQALLGLKVWIGGKMALQLKGFAHFVQMNKIPNAHLYSAKLTRLPKWIFELKKIAQFEFQQSKLFSDDMTEQTLSQFESGKMSIKISSPERAILELLDGIPNEQTFDETKLIFENLSILRPSVLQTLLEDCSSIKVKRLFLYFAEESGHAWFKKINASKIDLGSGKRAIVPKGKLNLKYQILIPSDS